MTGEIIVEMKKEEKMIYTAFYAALLMVIYFITLVPVIKHRRREGISFGTAQNPQLERKIRVHGNFIETVPLALILMGLVESLNGWPLLLHGVGIALFIGRFCHYWGFSQDPDYIPARVIGMVLTLNALIILAFASFILSLMAFLSG